MADKPAVDIGVSPVVMRGGVSVEGSSVTYGNQFDIRVTATDDDTWESHGANLTYLVAFPQREGATGTEVSHFISFGYFHATSKDSFLTIGTDPSGDPIKFGRFTTTFEAFLAVRPNGTLASGARNTIGVRLPIWDYKDGNLVEMTIGGFVNWQFAERPFGGSWQGGLAVDGGAMLTFNWNHGFF